MNGQKRIEIRAAAGAQVQAALDGVGYAGTLFNGRRVDARANKQFISLTLDTGLIEASGVRSNTRAEMVILIADASATDDQLDTIADTVEAGLAMDPTLAGTVSGITILGWEYPADEQTAFSMLAVRFSIIYPNQ